MPGRSKKVKALGRISATFALLAFGFLLRAAAPVPRPAPPFTVQEPSGKGTSLASLKGKVVVVQFLSTGCSHCQQTAMGLSRVQSELGPKGLAVYGVAFNDEVNTKDDAKNKAEVKKFDSYAKFPVGMASDNVVQRFLGLSVLDHYAVPQIVVIDKKGIIRAQTSPYPKAGEVIEEPVLRGWVTKLLAEK
jgi:peroxiredoxin